MALRPVCALDTDWLRPLASSPDAGRRYRYRGLSPSPDRFEAELWNDVLCQFVIWGRSSGRPLGLVTAFAPSLRDGHAHLGVLLSQEVQGKGWSLEGVGLFVEHVFATFGLRKLYIQTSTLWPTGFDGAIGDLLVEEARLTDHDSFDGRYGDSVIYALWRDRWLSHANRYRNLLWSTDHENNDNDVHSARHAVAV